MRAELLDLLANKVRYHSCYSKLCSRIYTERLFVVLLASQNSHKLDYSQVSYANLHITHYVRNY